MTRPRSDRAHRARRARAAGTMLAFAGVVGLLGTTIASPATAAVRTSSLSTASAASVTATTSVTPEQQLVHLVNVERMQRGLKPYVVSATLSAVAEKQARSMAIKKVLFHNPTLTSDIGSWRALGENVGEASSVSQVHVLLMNSPPHRANLLSTTFTQIGLGVVKDSHGTVWVCEVFRKPI